MYSQNDEERCVVEFFSGQSGRFLDVGAYDGVQMSNTRRLLELGWSGVLVEPMWSNFDALCRNCSGLDTVLVCAAVSSKPGLRQLWTDLHISREWSATVNEDLFKLGSVMIPSKQNTVVACVTIEHLFLYGPFDFISIDAEWEDFEILKSQPAKVWRTAKLICVEPRGIEERQAMKAWFANIGFATAHETPENLIVKRTE